MADESNSLISVRGLGASNCIYYYLKGSAPLYTQLSRQLMEHYLNLMTYIFLRDVRQ